MELGSGNKDDLRRNIISRLKKIEGQVRGIQDMVAGNKECVEVLTQLRAVTAALRAVNGLVLKNYIQICYRGVPADANSQELLHHLDQTVGVLSKFIEG